MKKIFLLFLCLASCTPIGALVSASSTAGKAASQDRGLSGAVHDWEIESQINHLWFQKDVDMFRALNLEVIEGRVLITGAVNTPDQRVEAVRLAWHADNVKEVINEIQINESYNWQNFIADSWIDTQLRTQLIFDNNILNINYSTEVINGIVYIIGVAQSQQELDIVINTALNIGGVKKVIPYVRIKGTEKK